MKGLRRFTAEIFEKLLNILVPPTRIERAARGLGRQIYYPAISPQTHSSQFQQGIPPFFIFGWDRPELAEKWWRRAQNEHMPRKLE